MQSTPKALRVLSLATALLLCGWSVSAQSAEYAVSAVDAKSIERLGELGLDTKGRPPEFRVFVHSPEQEAQLLASGLTLQLIQADVQRFYASRLTQGARQGTPLEIGQGSMGGYFTEAEIVQFMDDLASQHSDIVAPRVSIGTTLEGRDIWMWRISDNPLSEEGEPEVLLDGGMHGREVISVHALLWFAQHLCNGYGVDQELTDIVTKREIHLVPLVNVDGYVYNQMTHPAGGGMWRKNRRPNAGGSFGVDLNRNFSFAWGIDDLGSSPNPSSEVYRGTAPFSEPAAMAMRNLASGLDLSLAATLHSFGNAVFIPPNYGAVYPPAPLRERYETFAAELRALPPAYTIGYSWQALPYTSNGSEQDWWYGQLYGGHAVWAFGFEIGSATDGFWPATSRILPLCREAGMYLERLMRLAGPDPRIVDVEILENGVIPGVWEPGEQLGIELTVTNQGTLPEGVTLTLEPASAYVGIVTPQTNLGALGPFGGTASTQGHALEVQIDPLTPTGTEVAFDIVAEGLFGIQTRHRVTHRVGLAEVLVHATGFELSPEGWSSGWIGDTATTQSEGAWTLDDPVGTSWNELEWNPEDDHTVGGTHCWFTGQGVVGGHHAAADVDGVTNLVSPVYDLANVLSPRVEYWRWFATNGTDVLRVFLSNDGGLTWTGIDTVATQVGRGWVHVVHDLGSHLPITSAMRLRIQAEDIGFPNLVEAAIDDLRVVGFEPLADIQAVGPPLLGATVGLPITSPWSPGRLYLMGVSLTAHQGIPTPFGLVPLDPDPLFFLAPVLPDVFRDFYGVLDAQGAGLGMLDIPNVPSLSGVTIFCAGAVGDATTIDAITGALRITIQ
jgi:hypothetical protein